MATGSQKVKTPSGVKCNLSAWLKLHQELKDVDQIYIKTPSALMHQSRVFNNHILILRMHKSKYCSTTISLYCERTRTEY